MSAERIPTGLTSRRALMRRGLGVVAVMGAPAILAGCQPGRGVSDPVSGGGGATPPVADAELTPTGAVFPRIADAVTKLTPSSARKLKSLGVETIFRYYSYVPSNIRGKDLTPAERDVIFDAGLSVGVVFQHYNNCFDTFANDWGARDAAQALRLAEKNAQPRGSAIYFGVDGDFPYASMIADQLRYMEAVAQTFSGSGYKIGVYGGGCALDRVRREGLAQLFWLSGSTGFTGTKAFYNQGNWSLFQNAYDFRTQGSIGMDSNWANPRTRGAVGQWNRSGVSSGDSAATRKIYEDRRFTRRNVIIRSASNGGASSRGTLKADRNVRALAEGGGWTEILTREGGSGVSTRGFVETTALSSVERFTSQASYGLCGADIAPPASVRNANCPAAARAFRR